MAHIDKEIHGLAIVGTYFLAITNQGYWGRGCVQEDEDPLQKALELASALGSTGKLKRGVAAHVAVFVVTEKDTVSQEEIDNDRHGLIPRNVKAGETLRPYCGGYGNAIWKGTKIAEFDLG